MGQRFHGIFTPLVTPITRTGAPDFDSFERLVRFQLEGGVHGLWVMGTSAEFAAFSPDERAGAVAAVVETVAGRVPVIANVSDAGTRLAIQHAQLAAEAGADAIAATPPYYYPHGQDELLAHYRAIHDAVDLPLYIYNIPQTVRVRVDLASARWLAEEGIVAGIKDSQNDLEWFRQLVQFVRDRDIPFVAFAGTRYLIDAAVLAGADGAIPSIANAVPDLCVAVYERAATGHFAASDRLESRVISIESAARLVQGGSANAKTLGLIKSILCERGVIAGASLSLPLRTPTEEERRAMWAEVEPLLAARVAG